MSEFMKYYEMGRKVPPEAQQTIVSGPFKGQTEINPMWDIKRLTEMFGPCGLGWYTDLPKFWHTESTAGTSHGCELIVSCRVNLYVRFNGEWSKPIVGIGGSKMVIDLGYSGETIEDDEYCSDQEACKRAYADAIATACRSLGIGADFYYAEDLTGQ